MLYLVLTTILSFYALWIFYLAVMGLKRAKDAEKLNKAAFILGIPVLLVGYTLDACVNIFIMSLIMLEIPQEVTVTSRLSRHIRESNGWRSRIASWFIPLLDPFDPSGKHLK